MTKQLLSSVFWLETILKATIYFLSVSRGLSTDIEELSVLVDRSLGYDVRLPVLACHSKTTGYHEISWYKDGVVIQTSFASLSGHVLSLGTLLAERFSNVFDNPLKLQGYYWCDIDLNFTTKIPQKYFFRIPSVHTYVGNILASKDHVYDGTLGSLKNETEIMKSYENDLQNVLFAFLPKPNAFVTDINQTEDGLVVSFFLYAQMSFNPRQPSVYNTLIDDENQLKIIYDYLNGRISIDPEYQAQMQTWTQQHGVSLIDMQISSTIGCYREVSGSSRDKQLTWPYAVTDEIAVSEEGCLTEDELPVARRCLGSFTKGVDWGSILGCCEVSPHNRSTALMALLTSPGIHNWQEYTRRLNALTDDPKDLSVLDLHIATILLQDISEVRDLSISDIDSVFTTIDNMMQANIDILNTAKGTLRLSTRMLDIIDRVTDFSYKKELTIAKSSVVVAARSTKTADDMIVGVSVVPPEQWASSPNNSVRFMNNGSDITTNEMVAGFMLPEDLVIKREKDLLFPCQLDLVYFSDWRLFGNPSEALRNRMYEALPTPVIHVGITGGPAWNLTNPIRFYFRNDFKTHLRIEPVCSYFDPKLDEGFGGWATEGCTMEGLKNDYYVCHCHHIAMVSLAVPGRPEYLRLFKPRNSLFIGCAISIGMLSFVVLLYIFCKTCRQTEHHHILFYLALAMLCSLILLLVHNVYSRWRPGCMFLTVVFHYFVQVTFCWVLIQSLVHHSRFCRDTEIEDMGKFLTRANVFAWDFPFVTVGITWVVKGSAYYHHKICWATMIEVSDIIVYPVALLLLLAMCFNAIVTYCVTCGYFKTLELKSKRHDESILRFKISLSFFILFFLSWLFGYLSLHKKPKEFQILFAISIVVTSLYICVFFLFHDNTPMDHFAKMRSRKTAVVNPTDAIAPTEVKTYNATEQ